MTNEQNENNNTNLQDQINAVQNRINAVGSSMSQLEMLQNLSSLYRPVRVRRRHRPSSLLIANSSNNINPNRVVQTRDNQTAPYGPSNYPRYQEYSKSNGHIMMVETNNEVFTFDQFSEQEKEIIKQQKEILMFSNTRVYDPRFDTFFRHLYKFKPRVTDEQVSLYVFTWKFSYDAQCEQSFGLKARMYIKSSCYDLIKFSTIHYISFLMSYNNICLEPFYVTQQSKIHGNLKQPSNTIRLPLICDKLSQFSKILCHVFKSPLFPSPTENRYAFMSHASESSNFETFFKTRETYKCHEWILLKTQSTDYLSMSQYSAMTREYDSTVKTTRWCPFSSYIIETHVDENVVEKKIFDENGVKGGVLYGDCMSGKSFNLIKQILNSKQQFSVDDQLNINEITMIFIPFYELYNMEKIFDILDAKSFVSYIWDHNDYLNFDNIINQKPICVVNWNKFILTPGLRERIRSMHFKRIVFDDFSNLYHTKQHLDYMCGLQSDIIWVTTSQMYNIRVNKALITLFKFYKVFPEVNAIEQRPLLSYQIFRTIFFKFMYGVHNSSILECRNGYQQRVYVPQMAIHSFQENDFYPHTHIIRSVNKCLNSFVTVSKVKSLIHIITALESGVPIKKYDVDDFLLSFTNTHTGGKMYVKIPPYNDMTFDVQSPNTMNMEKNMGLSNNSDSLCCICFEPYRDPVRNASCDHVLCYNCLKQWNVENSSCPMCRKDYSATFFRQNPLTDIKNTSKSKIDNKFLSCYDFTNIEDIYYNPKLFNILNNTLQHKVEDLLPDDSKKILILSCWPILIKDYERCVKENYPQFKSGTLLTKFKSNELDVFKRYIKDQQIIISHIDNVQLFCKDSNIIHVIFMDVNINIEYMQYYYNYFKYSKTKTHMIVRNSISEYYSILCDSKTRKNRNGKFFDSICPILTPKEIIKLYR